MQYATVQCSAVQCITHTNPSPQRQLRWHKLRDGTVTAPALYTLSLLHDAAWAPLFPSLLLSRRGLRACSLKSALGSSKIGFRLGVLGVGCQNIAVSQCHNVAVSQGLAAKCTSPQNSRFHKITNIATSQTSRSRAHHGIAMS